MLVDAGGLSQTRISTIASSAPVPPASRWRLSSSRQEKRIALLEGGGEHVTSESQSLYEGKVIGDKYFALNSARFRCFGGSSNHWAGWCKTLDEANFLPK